MAITKPKEKLKVIEKLQFIRDKVDRLYLPLAFAGKADEALAVQTKSQELTDQITDLIGQAMDSWGGSLSNVVKALTEANSNLQKHVREIERNIKTAENVVKLVGYVDDVIAIAAKVAALG